MRKKFASFVFAMACVAIETRAYAEETKGCSAEVTRANVVPCALARSLSVRGEEKTLDALQGKRVASKLFLPSNPVLSLSGGRRVAVGGTQDAINWYATLAQEIEIAGQRGSRVRSVDASLVAQDKRVLLSKRESAVLAWTAYFEAIAAREQKLLTERLLATAERMRLVARAKADKGLSATLDADLADAASLRLLQLKLAADRSVAATNAQLAFLLDRDPSANIAIEGELVPLGNVSRTTPVEQRPEVQAHKAERDALLLKTESFRRSRVPNPTISLFVQNDGFNERVYGLGLALPIPLPSPVGRTYAGEIAEAKALAERADIDRSRTERELRMDLVDAEATHTAHRLAVE